MLCETFGSVSLVVRYFGRNFATVEFGMQEEAARFVSADPRPCLRGKQLVVQPTDDISDAQRAVETPEVYTAREVGRCINDLIKALERAPPIQKFSLQHVKPGDPWDSREIRGFPMVEGCLNDQTLVRDLSTFQRDRIQHYMASLLPEREPRRALELVNIFEAVLVAHPDLLRVQEVMVSGEAFRCIHKHLLQHDTWRDGEGDAPVIFDCGWGLVGILLAVAFPQCKVICTGSNRQKIFEVMIEACCNVMVHRPNISVVEADVSAVLDSAKKGDTVIGIHVGKEDTQHIIEGAVKGRARWIVMPCSEAHGDSSSPYLDVSAHVRAESRHHFHCGIMACQHGAQLIRQVESAVTRLNVLLFSDGGPASDPAT